MKLGRFILGTVAATAAAGTFDLIAAAIIARTNDSGAVRLLQHIASGAFGTKALVSLNYMLVGLVLHYAIIAVMAGVYMLAAPSLPMTRSRPLLPGALYGLLLWAVMTLVVVPLRWRAEPAFAGPLMLVEQLFCHIVLVGMPIALVYAWVSMPAAKPARRGVRPRRSGATPVRAPRR